MFCTNCGKEVAEGQTLCEECQAAKQAQQPVEETVAQPVAPSQPAYDEMAAVHYTEKARKKSKMAFIFGIVAMAVMIVAAIVAGVYSGFMQVAVEETDPIVVDAIVASAGTVKVFAILFMLASLAFSIVAIVMGATGIPAYKNIPGPKSNKLLVFCIIGLALGALAAVNLLSILPFLAV